ncbi:hypothetical protein Y032_0028g1810 [Ancylostoma ceylanicum]|uniref:Uncharacterized protein n=1 Tax=Ancylostoma ceylanicum TaxID=53326 RepID=A0A016UT09_9BILA|nr:hypothetical protein Y032_0028g1810 [Ancylostoma ceylanicum]
MESSSAIGYFTSFNLKTAKQKLTRQLNALGNLIKEAEEFSSPWQFSTTISELQQFLITKTLLVKELGKRLETQKDKIWEYYSECNCSIAKVAQSNREAGTEMERNFDEYWEERKGEGMIQTTTELCRQLEKRLLELQCQEAFVNQELAAKFNNLQTDVSCSGQLNPSIQTNEHPRAFNSWLALDRRLLGNELKVPEFSGNATEFESFWELFDELVHKQPYANIEKLSILINCCKGDAARAIKMIPRTGESYERVVEQLKKQYQNPRRVTMSMINKLKSMRQCREDSRSLRNNLNDVQAIIETLRKQGEIVDTTHMLSMVLDTFCKRVQEEVIKKEFDSNKEWNMSELLENLSTVVKIENTWKVERNMTTLKI